MNMAKTETTDFEFVIADITRLIRHLESLSAALGSIHNTDVIATIECLTENKLSLLFLKNDVGNVEAEVPVLDYDLEIEFSRVRLARLHDSQRPSKGIEDKGSILDPDPDAVTNMGEF
jgi:hypothetical protein